VFQLHQIAHMLVSARAEALSYSAVKLFSKNSNLHDHGTWTLRRDGQTDRRHAISSPRSALASRGKNESKKTRAWVFFTTTCVFWFIAPTYCWPALPIVVTLEQRRSLAVAAGLRQLGHEPPRGLVGILQDKQTISWSSASELWKYFI